MKRIEIPFRDDMAIAAIDGEKTKTTRSKRYGDAGDVFEITDPRTGKDHAFVLTSVFRSKLAHVAVAFCRAEGCRDSEAFIKVWKELHPRNGWTPEETRVVHAFMRVKE